MQYRAISADGHVNEPPKLWVDNLPDKFKDRGPHVIETPKTKGHAWIMEGQSRPAVMGFCSMYFTLLQAVRPGVADRGLQADQETGASATRTCSPARMTPRPASKRSSRTRPTPR